MLNKNKPYVALKQEDIELNEERYSANPTVSLPKTAETYFVDAQFGINPELRVRLNGISIVGKFEYEASTDKEGNAVLIIRDADSRTDRIELSFVTFNEMYELVSNIHTYKALKGTNNTEFKVDHLINQNVLLKDSIKKIPTPKEKKALLAGAGVALLGLGLGAMQLWKKIKR